MKIETSKIVLHFHCPECKESGIMKLDQIVETGTAVCTDCDEDMELDDFVEVRE